MERFILKALAIGVVGISLIFSFAKPTQALSGSSFKAGRIIDDQIFYDSSTLSVSEIKDFLKDMLDDGDQIPDGINGSCDSDGSEPYGNSTRAQVAASWSNGHTTPFVCLPNYYENPTTKENNYYTYSSTTKKFKNIYDGTKPEGAVSSAKIIYDVSQQFGINPQVLIVLLQKETGLVKDDWPLGVLYRKATGYGCPDGGSCNSAFYGFYNQVYRAARQFTLYRDNPDNYGYVAGQNNRIYWHPNNSCGSSWVYIENQATAGLYNYTPYRPNSAALNNLYGTGNNCSSYGNRNFWTYFNNWFGSTEEVLVYSNMLQSRWLETTVDLQKTDIRSGYPIGSVIPSGTQIYFSKKIDRNDTLYLRTRHDIQQDYDRGIPLSSLAEIDTTYEPMATPRWMETKDSYTKINPISEETVDSQIPAGTKIYFEDKIEVGETLYLRTIHDKDLSVISGLPFTNLNETTITHSEMSQPRWLISKEVNPVYGYAGRPTSDTVEIDNISIYTHKVTINDTTYVRTSAPSESDTNLGIKLSGLNEIEHNFNDLNSPRWMVLTGDTNKVNLETGLPVDELLLTGTQLYFSTKARVAGVWYLRTRHDTTENSQKGIQLSSIGEISLVYEDMLAPRSLKTKQVLYKIHPLTRENVYGPISKNTIIPFSTKIVINNRMFLRTTHDTNLMTDQVIPLSLLSETN